MQERFLWHFPYLEGIQGVLDGVSRGPVGPPGPLELAALHATARATFGTGAQRSGVVRRLAACLCQLPLQPASCHLPALLKMMLAGRPIEDMF